MDFDPVTMTSMINTVANLISVNLNANEISIASVFFTQLGDTLATISVVRELKPSTDDDKQPF